MTTVAFVGLGKLGTPLAVAMSLKHKVVGYDVDSRLCRKRMHGQREQGVHPGSEFQPMLDAAIDEGRLSFASLQDAVEQASIVFVCVQTPHQERFDGTHRLTDERADFDYTHLKEAVVRVAEFAKPEQTVAIISTVLPGTLRREILPITRGKCKVVYQPSFCSMGNVVGDFLRPEFVLIGTEDKKDAHPLFDFYGEFFTQGSERRPPFCNVSIESAELVKVAYNSMVTMKCNMGNAWGEIAHKVPGCNIDEVCDTLANATRRLWSPAYTRMSVADGGNCHPRDCMAMSWLSRELNLSADVFEDAMQAREDQTEWLSDLIRREHWNDPDKPVILLGKAFKPETAITAGSCSLLLQNMLRKKEIPFIAWDPYVDENSKLDLVPAIYFIATKHACFAKLQFPAGSVVIDPHRYVPDQTGVEVLRLGVGK